MAWDISSWAWAFIQEAKPSRFSERKYADMDRYR